MRIGSFLLVFCLAACGGEASRATTGSGGQASASSAGGAGGPASGGGGSGGFAPAPHAPFPQVPNQGGPRLDHVHMVSVNFTGTKYATELAAFGDWIVTSDWFTAAGAEYGVHAGTHEQRLLDETPPGVLLTTNTVQYLTDRITSGALPMPDAETLYVFYFPPQTHPFDLGSGCEGGDTHPSA